MQPARLSAMPCRPAEREVYRRFMLKSKGLAISWLAFIVLEPCARKLACTVLGGGKSERIYLSRLFNLMIHKEPYHNLNI